MANFSAQGIDVMRKVSFSPTIARDIFRLSEANPSVAKAENRQRSIYPFAADRVCAEVANETPSVVPMPEASSSSTPNAVGEASTSAVAQREEVISNLTHDDPTGGVDLGPSDVGCVGQPW